MTTQEFVKQEVEKELNGFPNGLVNLPKIGLAFSDGLTKGLEIAADYSVWKENNYVKVWDKYCHRHSDISEKRLHLTFGYWRSCRTES